MLAVVLEFAPIDGMENEFIQAWTECTNVIYENFGSLGSRLHRSDKGSFIAYAQWPNKIAYDGSSDWPEHLIAVRDRMRSLLKGGKPNVLHVLQVEVDLLKSQACSQ